MRSAFSAYRAAGGGRWRVVGGERAYKTSLIRKQVIGRLSCCHAARFGHGHGAHAAPCREKRAAIGTTRPMAFRGLSIVDESAA